MRFERKLSRHREKYNISRNKRPPSWGRCSVHSSSCCLPAPHPFLTATCSTPLSHCCLLHTPFSVLSAHSTPLSQCLLPASHPFLSVICLLHTPFSLSQSLLSFLRSLSPHCSFCLSLLLKVFQSVCLSDSLSLSVPPLLSVSLSDMLPPTHTYMHTYMHAHFLLTDT